MIHRHQLGLIKVKHFAQFLGDLELIVSVVRRELRLTANPEIFVRIRLNQTGLRQRQTEWCRTQDVCDEAKLCSVPRIKVGTGTCGNLQFNQRRQRRAGLDVDGTQQKIPPANGQRIRLGIAAKTDLHRHLRHCATQSKPAGRRGQAHADPAGVRPVAGQPHLELVVRIATVIAGENQSAAFQAKNEVGVAVVVEVRKDDRVHRDIAPLVQTGRHGVFLKTCGPAVAPETHSDPTGHDVQPAVVVKIDQIYPADRPIARRNGESLIQVSQHTGHSILSRHHQIVSQIVVEIAHRHDRAGRPVGGRVRDGQQSAAHLGQQKRHAAGSRRQHIGRVIIVPVIDDNLFDVRERTRNSGRRSDVLEVTVPQIAQDLEGMIRRHDQQIQFPDTIKIRQSTVNRSQIDLLQTRQRGDLRGHAIRGKAKYMTGLLAQNDHVVKMIIVQISHQAASISRPSHTWQQRALRPEHAARVGEQTEPVSLAHKKTRPAVVIEINDTHRAAELGGVAPQHLRRGIGELHGNSARIGLLQCERRPGHGVLGSLEGGRRHGLLGQLRENLLVQGQLFGRLVLFPQPDQRLTQLVMSRRVFRLKTNNLIEIPHRLLELTQLKMRPAELEVSRGHTRIQIDR